jgi:hypothetical protein
MQRLQPVLGYAGAILTVVAMLVGPFVLFPLFERGIAASGVEVDAVYTGGAVARVVAKDGYRITVRRPVRARALLARPVAFVQLEWAPAAALPARVADEVDLDGDGRADVTVRFAVPADTTAALFVDATPAGGMVRPLHRASRDSFSSLIARVGDRVVVRLPLAERKGREGA